MDLEQEIWENKLDSDSNSVTLDVRTPDEFNTSRIPNSINIDFYNPQLFMEEVQKLDKDATYFVYCRTGVRSANSCLLMKELGFSKTFNLIGGIVDWKGEIIT
jgi:rhodanese-related sulfurtransferase